MALSKKQRRALRAAKEDDKITKKESRQLKALGIPNRQAAATTGKNNGNKNKGKNKPQTVDQNTGLVNSKVVTNLSNEQQINLAAKGQLFNGRPGSGNNGPVKDSNSGDGGNETQIVAPVIPEYQGRGSGVYTDIIQDLDADALAGLKVAKELKNRGITQTDPRYDDLLAGLKLATQSGSGFDNTNLIQRQPGPGKKPSSNTLSRKDWNKLYPENGEVFPGSGNKISKAGWKRLYPESGDLYDDGLNAFGLPKLTAKQQREQNPYVVAPNKTTRYTGPAVETTGGDQTTGGDPATGGDNQTSQPEDTTLNDLLTEQQAITDAKIGELTSTYEAAIGGLELKLDGLNNANEQWSAANKFMEDQLKSANAARSAAEKRASNLRNAFVPTANPNALSVLYGDNRRASRRREDNQLSDLSILSGLGTTSNPLAGLQLA